jgi:hypothetical protein
MKKLQNTFLCLSLNAKLVLCVKYYIVVVLHYDTSRMLPACALAASFVRDARLLE